MLAAVAHTCVGACPRFQVRVMLYLPTIPPVHPTMLRVRLRRSTVVVHLNGTPPANPIHPNMLRSRSAWIEHVVLLSCTCFRLLAERRWLGALPQQRLR